MAAKRTQAEGAKWPSELALLRQIRSRARRGAAVRLGIGDDCALLRMRTGEEIAVTTDLSIAGRHFRFESHPPESVGHRALTRGLSDLAAMGARPLAAFLSLGLPRDLTVPGKPGSGSWMSLFLDGLLRLADAYRVPLAGGDLAESPAIVADIVLVGAVPRGRALLRSDAHPGHLLYVTGALGAAAAGFARLPGLKEELPRNIEGALKAHLFPQPRVAQGEWLQRRGLATAAIDLSDGLSTDLTHLCEESRVAAEVDAAALPIHHDANLEQALHGGEDYELLFAARPSTRIPRSIAGVSITKIGRVVKPMADRPTVALITGRGSEALEARGWEHFA
ncbi:MAG TPA: thiamine-phosphate kinase [Terracidiphilus sp.]|nr:thiamine-phosphate kinase [Terracidiphilus sp.]